MRSPSSRRAIGPVVALLLLGFTAPACQGSASDRAVEAPSSAQVVDRPTAQRTYFPQYGSDTHAYRPHRLEVSVDGSLFITRMRWRTWTASRAVGTGVAHVNDCKPDCADGHYSTHRVTVRLSHPRQFCGSRFFTTLSVRGPSYHTYARKSGVACG